MMEKIEVASELGPDGLTRRERATLFGWLEQPVYREQEVPGYQGNPCIEALPPIQTADDIALLARYPDVREEFRDAETQTRIHLTFDAIEGYWQTFPIHLTAAQRLGIQIRSGLTGRNPLTARFWQENAALAAAVADGSLTRRPPTGKAPGLLIYGDSGNGKSEALRNILGTYNQVIKHRDYHGVPLHLDHLVYLHLECPKDGSLVELCRQFFREVDRRLGTRYFSMYVRNKKTTDHLLGDLVLVARNHALGLLAIDEIQHLLQAPQRGKVALNFLVTLINYIGLPVTLVGTPSAMALFSKELRLGRRLSKMGDLPWPRMRYAVKEPDAEDDWNLLLDGLEQYQYTKSPAVLTPPLREALYWGCQGITEIAVNLFFCVQRHLIEEEERPGGDTEWTPELVRWLAYKDFTVARPGLAALRSGDALEISRQGDIMPLPPERFDPGPVPPPAPPPVNEVDGAPESTASQDVRVAAPRKAAPRKAAPKDTAPKDTAPKKAAPKDTAPKKAAPKKTAPKKAPRARKLPVPRDGLSVVIAEGTEQGLDTHAALVAGDMVRPLQEMEE